MSNTFEITLGQKHIIAYSEIDGHQLVPGDLYIAKRNTGWHLAKCKYVNHEDNWVMPDPPCSIYSYNCNECYKVKEVNIIGGCGATVYAADGYVCPYFSRYAEWSRMHGLMGPCEVDMELETKRCLHAIIELNLDIA